MKTKAGSDGDRSFSKVRPVKAQVELRELERVC